MVKDPADYRWSSYGEAVGGRVKGYRLTRLGPKGNGKKAREGLVRACMSHQGGGFEAEKWKEVSRIYRRALGLALGRKQGRAEVASRGLVTKNTAEMLESRDNETVLPDLRLASMLRHRVRYLTPRPFRPSVQRSPPPEAGSMFGAKRLRLLRMGR